MWSIFEISNYTHSTPHVKPMILYSKESVALHEVFNEVHFEISNIHVDYICG